MGIVKQKGIVKPSSDADGTVVKKNKAIARCQWHDQKKERKQK
jgi:hypothetical protein